MSLDKKLTVIVGLGKTGFSCAKFLAERNQSFAITDHRKEPPQLEKLVRFYPRTELALGKLSENLLCKAKQIILSPGVPLSEPIIAKQIAMGKPVISDIELFAQVTKKPIVAITGSNGKTTVTTIIELMMKLSGINAITCGNIGRPVLQQIYLDPEYYVLELSSFQLETTFSLKPYVATILNISEDHMDRYVSLAEYIRAKQRIYNSCAIPVINADASNIYKNFSFKKRLLSFGFWNRADFSLVSYKGSIFIAYRGHKVLSVKELKLHANHNIQNALAALALGTAVDIPIDIMCKVLRNFTGIQHCCQWVRKYKGVDYYNDSKGTNVSATQAAIVSLGNAMKGKLILIAGGKGKGADFFALKSVVKRYVKQVVLIGEDTPRLESALHGCTKILRAFSMEEAVKRSSDVAQPGEGVLLSPACASYDMFKNYAHRGNVFSKIVKEL
ncbi:UDP-N-acetylmuramoyl-L-alanine--D-glutamate ligase [Coxiella endosymbiont of Amblyomma americanum]|uniref:UDP-N-acetylmuramoyl-L-alanine--D-glutamate ligase n=1 Tax=Coxiella endosymbiont of Amblyomma americanum TaxID=325775 RepID=UPI00057F262F|nr:UDP-N-acetylmuramoyl-L-alanine--D-glutamate ligase [Coxiella endosymbiont of Amblyomma americanum]AJC50392.1 UDP-N-acetylmuramoyl-L-alanyl-D-glutamate synthetase [Coxiella endosymbiont of Amblyomma americanum]AUJ58733.1 UDP-N-acetylmuramoyl-L-alanine--D-glutamate ligase [Coxiella-like endosymbiont of Amblyomma americanum]